MSQNNTIPVGFVKHVESEIQFNEFVDLRCGARKQE